MPTLFYAVTAIIEDPAVAREYLAWLTPDHTDAVIAAGAESARVITLDTEGPTTIETQYLFPSREAFAAYEAGPAIPLREDGRSRFASRVEFTRRVGEVIAPRSV